MLCEFFLAGDSQHGQVSIPLKTSNTFRSLLHLKQAVAEKFKVIDPSSMSFVIAGNAAY